MATVDTVRLHIAGLGHVLYAKVGTAVPDISKFKFGDESTYGEFKWMGDTSSENLLEFETDGGDANFKRTWDRVKVRAVYEDQTVKGTLNSLNISREVFEIAFGGGEYKSETDSYDVKATGFAEDYALLVVSEDGRDISALSLPKVSIQGSFPTYSIEEFVELPLSLAIQADNNGTLWTDYFPRPYAATAQTDPVETE